MSDQIEASQHLEVVWIHDGDSAIVEVTDVPRCKTRSVNPRDASDDGVRHRDWSTSTLARANEITVAIRCHGVERQESLLGLAEQGIGFCRQPATSFTRWKT
jgi:hypothetical protein